MTPFRNPVLNGSGEDHGDPFVIRFLDSFFLYHTGETAGRRGISVHTSDDLVDWTFQGYALEAAEHGWAWSDLWAPEVVYEGGMFYMYVSATRQRASSDPRSRWQQGEGEDRARRLGVARSESPLGPFVVDDEPLVDRWSIDGHPFRDDDGTMWLFYNVLTEELGIEGVLPGTGTVVDRLVAPDRVAGRPTPVTLPSEAWEGLPDGDWYWNEGPYVLKRRGRYFQMYSGGWFANDSYAIGLASAQSVRGPWAKDPDNPVVRGRGAIRGPGHHSFVFGPDVATPYAVYHGYVEGQTGRKVHLDRLFWCGDKPLIAGPTEAGQPRPAASVFDPDVPHWRAEAWARGSWAEVGGERFALEPADAWHQVEVVQSEDRFAVRVGGVLRASRPGVSAGDGTVVRTDGEIGPYTATSCLKDEGRRGLPGRSTYAWAWGGAGPLELSLAVRGPLELRLDDRVVDSSDSDGFRLVQVTSATGARSIVATAGSEGATIADLSVIAR